MKIRYMSDLHLEFGDFAPKKSDEDVVVLAGDIHVGMQGLEWALENFSVPVLYVMGNHEYYGQTMPTLVERLRSEASGTHVHIMENDEVKIGDTYFMGATMWTDFKLWGIDEKPATMLRAQALMNDYKEIRIEADGYRSLRAVDTVRMHNESIDWMEDCLSKRSKDDNVVVISHHAPSIRGVKKQFRNDDFAAAYASDISHIEGLEKVDLWIHGHTHKFCDYRVGNVRVLSNPRGYVGHEVVRNFRDDRLYDTDKRMIVESGAGYDV